MNTFSFSYKGPDGRTLYSNGHKTFEAAISDKARVERHGVECGEVLSVPPPRPRSQEIKDDETLHCEYCDAELPEEEMKIVEEDITWNQFNICPECFTKMEKSK